MVSFLLPWQNSCQEWGGTQHVPWAAVRSGTGIPQVPWSVSRMVQVPRRLLGQCQEWCKYSAGALVSVRSGAEIGLLSVFDSTPELSVQPLIMEQTQDHRDGISILYITLRWPILHSAGLYYSLLTHLRAVSTAPLFIVYCKPAILHGNCALLLYNHWAERWELGNLVKVFLWLDQQ